MKKNRILVVIIISLSLIFICFQGGRIPYALFGASIILPLFSIAYTIGVYSKFKFSHHIDKKIAIKGDNIKYSCIFYNDDSFFYPYIKIVFFGGMEILDENIKMERSFSLLPQERKHFSYNLKCKYRGSYEFGVRSIRIEDFLGIISLKYKVPNAKSITVNPRLIQIKKFSLQTSYISDVDMNAGKQSSVGIVMSDIRKYCYGDNVKRIHWKITSKLNKLMTKNYEETGGENVILLIDLKRAYNNLHNNILCEDLLIESVLSLSHYYLANWIGIKFLMWGYDIHELSASNLNDYGGIYKFLSNVSFSLNYDITMLVKHYLRNQINKSNIVLFVSDFTLDIYNQIYEIRKRGYNICLVFINPYELNSNSNKPIEALNRLVELGVLVYNIKSSESIINEFEFLKRSL